jgi:hypothetical protein
MASRGYGFVMRLRLKIPGLPYSESADQLMLKEWLGNLTHARKLVCRSLTAAIADAGGDPSDEERGYIDAHFKLLALVMAQINDIAALLRGR